MEMEEEMVGPLPESETPTQQEVEACLSQFRSILRSATTKELTAWDETTLSTAMQWAEGIEATLMPQRSTMPEEQDTSSSRSARANLVKAVVESPFLLEHPNGAEVMQWLAQACGEEGQQAVFDQVTAAAVAARAKEGVVLEAVQVLGTALLQEGAGDDALLDGARVGTMEMQAYAAAVADCMDQGGSSMCPELRRALTEHEHGGQLLLYLLRELSRRRAMEAAVQEQRDDRRVADRRLLEKELMSWVRGWQGVDDFWHAEAGLLADVAEEYFPVAEAYVSHVIEDLQACLRGAAVGEEAAGDRLRVTASRLKGLMQRSGRLEAYCRVRLRQEGFNDGDVEATTSAPTAE